METSDVILAVAQVVVTVVALWKLSSDRFNSIEQSLRDTNQRLRDTNNILIHHIENHNKRGE